MPVVVGRAHSTDGRHRNQDTDIYVALAFAALLLPTLRSGFTLQRWEGALLVAGYVAYVAWLWPK